MRRRIFCLAVAEEVDVDRSRRSLPPICSGVGGLDSPSVDRRFGAAAADDDPIDARSVATPSLLLMAVVLFRLYLWRCQEVVLFFRVREFSI